MIRLIEFQHLVEDIMHWTDVVNFKLGLKILYSVIRQMTCSAQALITAPFPQESIIGTNLCPPGTYVKCLSQIATWSANKASRRSRSLKKHLNEPVTSTGSIVIHCNSITRTPTVAMALDHCEWWGKLESFTLKRITHWLLKEICRRHTTPCGLSESTHKWDLLGFLSALW